MAGTLFVVATPIGNLEDITARALRVLREVAIIAAEDTRRTGHLLSRYGISTRTTSLHQHNERGKTSALLERLESGESIALVSDAGTPTLSDPGHHLIAAAIERRIRIEPVPGPNAAIAALSVAGLAAETFTFLGFPPIRSKDRKLWMDRLSHSGPTVIFYEAPHRIRRTLDELSRVVGDVHVIVARELTKIHEELVRGPISEAIKYFQAPVGEFTVVAQIGLSTERRGATAAQLPSQDVIAAEFGLMTNLAGVTRRQSIAALAKRYHVSSREIYGAIEKAKRSGG